MKLRTAMLSLFRYGLALVIVRVLAEAQTGASTGTATIRGTVTDSGGVPIASATAYYSRRTRTTFQQGAGGGRPSASSPDAPLNGSAQTDATGAFGVPALPAGDYLLCAYASGYLDSCKWGSARTVAGLGATEARALPPIKLAKAALATVQVLDPGGLLPSTTVPDSPGTLSVAVRTAAGAFFPVLATSASGGRIYQAEVPYGTNVYVTVFSGTLRLTNSQGAALPSSEPYRIPVSAAEGSLLAAIVVNVVGKIASASTGGN